MAPPAERTIAHVCEPASYNGLQVHLAGNVHCLPWVTPGDVMIAYFDPRDPKLHEAGAYELVDMMDAMGVTTFVTPSSAKSGNMICDAVNRLAERRGEPIELITFQKGEPGSKEMAEHEARAAYKADYSPITAAGAPRVMVASHEQVDLLTQRGVVNGSTGIGVVDDVFSTGETTRAIKHILKIIGVPDIAGIRTATVMKEVVINEEGKVPDDQAPGFLYAVKTPVIPLDKWHNPIVPPEWCTSEPFSTALVRLYTEAERQHLRAIVRSTSVPDERRWIATLALAGHYNIPSSEGVFYFANGH